MDKLKKIPYHIFLLPIFFILHVINAYYGLIGYSIIIRFITVYLSMALLFLLCGLLLFRNLSKAGVWTTVLLVIFFFFGSFHDFLKKLSLPASLISYRVLLTLITLIVLVFSFTLKRTRLTLSRTNTYFSIVFFAFVFIELSTLLYKSMTAAGEENNLSYNNSPILGGLKITNNEKPDIFFIVFDEYASTKSLQKYLHYTNYRLDSTLTANDFFIAKQSKSNYNSTPFSIGSALNLDYFNKPLTDQETTARLRLQAYTAIKKSEFPAFLSRQGYQIFNFGLVDLKGSPVVRFGEFSTNDKKLAFYGETLLGRIKTDIWWNFKWLTNDTNAVTNLRRTLFEINANNFKLTAKELMTQEMRPKFVFLHVMMPHRPFVVDSIGKAINLQGLKISKHTDDSLYIQQLAYTNKWIKTLAMAAHQSFKRPRVVIIEGDHGFRALDLKKEAIYEKEFMNLNSYYFSDKDYQILYDSISPVNSFRVVLNKYFGAQLPLLKDSTILLY